MERPRTATIAAEPNLPAKIAGPVLRAGLTEVLVIGMQIR